MPLNPAAPALAVVPVLEALPEGVYYVAHEDELRMKSGHLTHVQIIDEAKAITMKLRELRVELLGDTFDRILLHQGHASADEGGHLLLGERRAEDLLGIHHPADELHENLLVDGIVGRLTISEQETQVRIAPASKENDRHRRGMTFIRPASAIQTPETEALSQIEIGVTFVFSQSV